MTEIEAPTSPEASGQVPDEPRRGQHLAYVPALDGVRAAAILVILGYHGGVYFTTGGFYSLDTFFALSGFLITSLLLGEWRETATIRLRSFWARRARRLLPALLLMLLAVAAYAAFVIPRGTYPSLRADSLWTLFYFANWHFIAAGSSYFNQTALTSPLTHTWSLAVEEQFYVLWPLIFLFVMKRWRSLRILLAVCIAGALASAIEMALMYSGANVNRVYYGTDTRAQALLVGAALAVGLAMWERRREAGPTGSGRGASALTPRTAAGRLGVLAIGLAGAVVSVLLWTRVSYNETLAFRGGFLVAALATAGVIFSVVCSPASPIAWLLSLAPVRFVGRISYGLYLWHFPLNLYLDHARTGLGGYQLFAARLAATFAVAVASFYLVERPIRRGTLLSGWRAWAATPVAVGVTAVALVVATALPTEAVAAPAHGMPARSALYSGPRVKVMMFGDSTALTLAIGLSEHQSWYDITEYDQGILGCGVTDSLQFQLKGVDAPMATQCNGDPADKQWQQIWKFQVDTRHPNVVMILAGRWEVANRTFHGTWTNIENPAYAAYVKRQLTMATRLAGSNGAKVALLTAPCFDSGEQADGQPWPEDSPKRLAIYNRIVRQVGASVPGTTVITFNAMACPGGHYEEYLDGQQIRLSDGVHFTFGGGNVFAPKIWAIVAGLGRQQMAEVAKAQHGAAGTGQAVKASSGTH